MGQSKNDVFKKLEENSAEFHELSNNLWDHPETGFNEKFAFEAYCEALQKHGFKVTKGYGDLDTAFSGEFGSGSPVIGILGEFDALPNLSQKAGSFLKEPVVEGGNGHGCGHNLLGVGAFAAACAIKDYLKENNLSGTVIYYGCPAEENGSGKAFMARDGAFDKLDLAITWHPMDINLTADINSLANVQVIYNFKGISSHAATAPELGRSALDALELMNVGVQFLREHIIDDARVHYSILDAGGASPNVVQPTASALYLIRAPRNDQVIEIYKRVNKIAQGAALMTETEVEYSISKACSNLIPNSTISKQIFENMQNTPQPEYTQEDFDNADQIRDTLDDKDNLGVLNKAFESLSNEKQHEMRKFLDKPLRDFVIPRFEGEVSMPGSSDVGDVSWICPTVQFAGMTMASATPGHSWQLVSQGKSDHAHKGMLWAAKVLAGTAIDFFESKGLIDAAKEEHKKRLGNTSYKSLMPDDCKPNPNSVGVE